jgi:PleD family two-component response regulator
LAVNPIVRTADTEDGVGTAGEAGDDQTPPAPPEPVGILLVDDDPKTLLALTAMLGDAGDIQTARSGPEALLRVIDRDFAVILLDVQMPDVDG